LKLMEINHRIWFIHWKQVLGCDIEFNNFIYHGYVICEVYLLSKKSY
jgi:hypothetical protein